MSVFKFNVALGSTLQRFTGRIDALIIDLFANRRIIEWEKIEIMVRDPKSNQRQQHYKEKY